ncbi:MAG: hypothetical protein J6I72_04845 [Muribaculaceae bacterium]|nr:hypothetical protein [Muribaculaceae bacterium]
MIASLKKFTLAAAIVIIVAMALPSCSNNYLIFEDDEWNSADFNGENLLLNGELEMDDYER